MRTISWSKRIYVHIFIQSKRIFTEKTKFLTNIYVDLRLSSVFQKQKLIYDLLYVVVILSKSFDDE